MHRPVYPPPAENNIPEINMPLKITHSLFHQYKTAITQK